MAIKGNCLCGKTTEENLLDMQIACHCTDCQQTSGSAFSTNVLAEQSKVNISGPTKEFGAKASSGNTVTRVFCGDCGAAIAHKSPAFESKMAVQTGNFADFRKVKFGAELFTKDRFSGLSAISGADQKETM